VTDVAALSATDTATTPPRRRGKSKGSRPGNSGYLRLFPMIPAVVLLLCFFVGPIIWGLYTSTTNQTLSGTTASNAQEIGLKNFRLLFGVGGGGGSAVKYTIIFTLACVIIQNVLGMVLALLMRKRNRYVRGVVSGIVVACWIVPEIVAGFVWYSFLAPKVIGEQAGTLSAILSHVGLSQNWLVSAPIFAVIVANGWRGTAFSMLIYGASVGDIPPEQLESAAVDGAGGLARLRYVILPAMRRIIASNTLLVTLQTLGVFTLIFTMTGGGPSNRSTTLPILMYNNAFNNFDIGQGNSIAVILLAVGALFATFYLIVLRPEAK
jgi:multiple sugar transport system permease protein